MTPRFVLSVLVALCLRGMCSADPNAAAVVTQVNTGTVAVNFGTLQRAQSGQEFYIYRGGYLVGRIRLTQVEDNGSVAQVVQTEPDASVQVGDVVSAFAPRPGTPSAGALSPAVAPAPPANLPPVDLQSATHDFEEAVKNNTRAYLFESGGQGKTAIQVPVTQLAMLAAFETGVAGRAYVYPPWMLASSAWVLYAASRPTPKRFRVATSKAYIQTVYWDERLLNTYARYYLYKQAAPVNAAQAEQTRQSMLAQKGLDKNIVFQVQITNKGAAPIAVAPFNWHFYLLDGSGNRVRATRYDNALDGSVTPNASIEGYVYFDRYNANGQSNLSGGGVKVLVDDVNGKHTTITW